MTHVHEVRLVANDVTVLGRFSPVEGSRGPLLVGIHGIGYDARYFDAQGMSVHDRAAAVGLSMLSITRPGYPASQESARVQPSFAESARIVSEAIGSFWTTHRLDSPGIVLLGHSVGGAVAIHLAAHAGSHPTDVTWPLLGTAVSGIGHVPAAFAVSRFASAPRDLALTLPFATARSAFYGPADTLPHDVEEILMDLLVPFPSADAVEVNSRWQSDFADVAHDVRVPIHITLAANDPLWVVNRAGLDEMAAAFTNSPSVTTAIVDNVGHNIEHHLGGSEYFRHVHDFVLACTTRAASPQ